MDQIEVQVIEAELFQRGRKCLLCTFIADICDPELSRNEQFISRNTAVFDGLPDGFFVAIGLSCINGAIAVF